MTKLRIAIIGVLVVTGIVALLVFRDRPRVGMGEKDEALLLQADRIAQLESENERLSAFVSHATNPVSVATEPPRELLRLRGEVGVLRQQTNEMGALRKDNATLSQALAESETNQLGAEDRLIVRQTHAVDATATLLEAIRKYAMNHNGQPPASLDQLVASGDPGVTNLAGNLRLSDFEFSPSDGGSQNNQAMLKLRVPIAKPGGGAVMVVGGINDAGVPHTSVWNVSP